MKKFGFLFPLLFILLFTLITPRLFSGAISPRVMLLISGALIAVLLLSRPKKAATKSAKAIEEEALDAYCSDVFTGEDELSRKFHGALHDIGANMPKAAVAKLEKLAAQCPGKKEQYAIAMATAYAWKKQNNYKNASREYNKAVVIYPNAPLAYSIGDCQQRLGYLDKARDSYEFAIELDSTNPQYPSSIATTYVGDGDYDTAMDYAADALALQDTFPQALATMAICYGMREDNLMHKHYLNLAMENGYKEEKILDTIKALKKREHR